LQAKPYSLSKPDVVLAERAGNCSTDEPRESRSFFSRQGVRVRDKVFAFRRLSLLTPWAISPYRFLAQGYIKGPISTYFHIENFDFIT